MFYPPVVFIKDNETPRAPPSTPQSTARCPEPPSEQQGGLQQERGKGAASAGDHLYSGDKWR